jgi:endonuclease G
MMKNLIKWTSLILASAMVMTAVSCRKTGSVTYEVLASPVKVQFNSNIGNEAVRAVPASVGSNWTGGDAIGVFMVAHNSTSNVLLNANNKKYVTQSGGTNGSFNPANGHEIYYPADPGVRVDFIAYYPYDEDITGLGDPVSVNVSAQNDPEAIDLLYANTVSTTPAGYNRAEVPRAHLVFAHKLSNVVINISSTDISAEDLAAYLTSVKIKGTNTTASFNLSLVTLGGQDAVADITAHTVTAGSKYDAILIPGSYDAGELKIEFTISGSSANHNGTYTYTAAEASTFVETTQYTYNLRLVEKRVVLLSATIDPWTDGGAINGDAEE